MPMKKSTRRPRRRVARKRRVPRGLGRNTGHSAKAYTFDFKLQPQVFRSGVSPSEPVIVRTGPATGPFTIGDFASGPAQTGMPLNYDVGFATGFSLGDIAQWSEYTQLFDQYRINYVELIIEALTSVSSAGPANGAGAVGVQGAMPTMYLAVDYDNTAVPTVVEELTGFQGVKKLKFGATERNTMKIRIRPRTKTVTQPLVTVGTPPVPTTVSLSAVNKSGQWIDCSYPNTIHYAVKGFVTDWLSTGTPNQWTGYRINMRYNVSFKQPIAAF